MKNAQDPIVSEATGKDFTSITFVPDLSMFKMENLDDDTIDLMTQRAHDIAACMPNIRVFLNDTLLNVNNFEDYCKLYLHGESKMPINLIYETLSNGWEIGVASSNIGFRQVSFVNGIATNEGGSHVNCVVKKLMKGLSNVIDKRLQKETSVDAFLIKKNMFVFVNCLVDKQNFNKPTKGCFSSNSKDFSKFEISKNFFKGLSQSDLMEKILACIANENNGLEDTKSKLNGFPNLVDANHAGTVDSKNCSLIVTEGESIKTLAVVGLGVIGRDRYGVFPLSGKRKLNRVLIFDSDDDEEINVMEKSKKLDLNQASYVVISSDEENRIPSKQPISITCLSSDEDISVDMKDCFAKKNTIDDDDLFEIL